MPPRQRKPGSVDVRSHLFIAPGIELQISPEEAGIAPEQLRALVSALMRAAEDVMGSSSMPTGKSNDKKTTSLKTKANQEEE